MAFLAYLLMMTYFLFLAEKYGRGFQAGELRYNLHPFQEIRRSIHWRHELGMQYVALNLFGNILIFIPFGAILPVLLRSVRHAGRMFVLSILMSLLIESLQLVFGVGSFDVDDIILNTSGGMIGYCVFAVCNRIRRKIYG